MMEQKDVPKDLITAASDTARCATYIVALNDTLFMHAGISSGIVKNGDAKIQMPYCLPDNIELEQYIKVILKYINENPDALDVHAAIVVYGALVKNFPCN